MTDIFDGIQFRNAGVDPDQWPRLSCSAANQLNLNFGNLTLEGNREIAFQGNGQLRVNADLRLIVTGNIGVNTALDPTEKLEVNGKVKATSFLGDGSALTGVVKNLDTVVKKSGDTITGPLVVQSSLQVDGNVGIGASSPQTKLDVRGHLTLETGGNPTVYTGTGTTELNRYLHLINSPTSTSASGLKAGGVLVADSYSFANPSKNDLVVKGRVGIGTPTPGFALDVADRLRVRQGGNGTAGIWFYQTTPAKDQAFVGMAGDTQVGFWGNTGANWGLVMDTTSGQVEVSKNLKFNGMLLIPNSGGSNAVLTGQKYDNEASFKNNNVKLSLGSGGIFSVPGGSSPQYEFMIGETFTGFRPGGITGGLMLFTNFVKRFSINQNGDLYCAGSKAGFVTDYFVNRVGDTLEQGDVVVISEQPVAYYSGSQNNIPILEVDLTEKAYDSRICGIVARFVTEQDLPHVEPESAALPAGMTLETLQAEATNSTEPMLHPLQQFAAPSQAEPNQVLDQQMGMMVTLGAFAHCKVDADIAPIAVGDLLTTSPTKGHAQKVLEPEKAVGTIVGKALAPLEKGQGKIPVLVMLQ